MTNMLTSQKRLTAKLAADELRPLVLPKHFPASFVQFEETVHRVMDKVCNAYKGGFWNFYELSNGGFYMAPKENKLWKVSVPFGNGFRGEMSSDAIGIVVCLYTYCFLAETDESMADHYQKLRDFAYTHAESDVIWWACD